MQEFRPLLTTYAYNILGSMEEARDVVQDAFLRVMQVEPEKIYDQKAYLVRTVINLAINQKKKQRKLVAADYPGEWLPEPVATERADTSLLQKEVLSYSLMVLLEKLNPRQRAVFILKEAFDYDHAEIAEVLDITEENSRKILNRAKQQLKLESPPPEKSIPAGYLDKYLDVIRTGDTTRLEKLLAEEVTIISDGGGKASAFPKPIHGRPSVISLLTGIFTKFYSKFRTEQHLINHQPALFYYDNDKLVTCQIFIIENEQIVDMFFIRNPDKLENILSR